jgi:ABC-type dipeptide/oligopeptide/nickel transport system permease component
LAAYLIRRFLLMLLTLFGISIVVFVLLRVPATSPTFCSARRG